MAADDKDTKKAPKSTAPKKKKVTKLTIEDLKNICEVSFRRPSQLEPIHAH